MLRPIVAFLAVALALASCTSGNTSGARQPSKAEVNQVRARHLEAVNAARIQSGLSELQFSAQLDAAAETQARDMSVQGRAWHFGSDLTSPRERAFRAGYLGELSGENIAEGTDSDLTVLQKWLQFPDTRAVILDPAARALGLGWYNDSLGKTWWVQVIGR
jgi:uncharacterized protein YkwD